MQETTTLGFWIAFNVGVIGLLAVDLIFFHRKAHAVRPREAGIWSAVLIVLALAFNVLILFWKGPDKAVEFFTAYLVEYSLSVDNLFVFLLIFTHFRVPAEYQHRVLFWGVLGALIMRGVMIALGVAIVQQAHWVLYLFGAFLLVTGIRMFFHRDEKKEDELEKNPVLRFSRRVLPLTGAYRGQAFVVHEPGASGQLRFMATPLLLVLIMVETTDLVFAVDSIPAVIAISQDPFIVYTSNVCAILGLRSLYFLLAHVVDKFVYLKYGLAFVLAFIGVKMLIADLLHIDRLVSLAVVAGALILSVVASLFRPKRQCEPVRGEQ
jgi:TerC family integral membrane protein